MSDITQMTIAELKQYLSANRGDDNKFSSALSELLKRDPDPKIILKDIPLEEQERIFKEKITKH